MIKQLTTKVVYKNPWISVREDQVEFANEYKGIYGVVDSQDFMLVVPFDGTYLYLVKQYRYPIQKYTFEFPQGKHEGDMTSEPAVIAQLELQEETGMIAGEIKKIGYLYGAPGHASYGFHIFFATDLQGGERKLDITEAGLETKKVSIQEFEQMILAGEIVDGPTVATYSLLKIHEIL